MNITIECLVCGFVAKIHQERFIPEGDCQFCRAGNFGWALWPGQFSDTESHKKFKSNLEDGDYIVINTTVPKNSDLRIFSIKRKNELIFEQNFR